MRIASTSVDVLIVDSSGNMGVGTSTPAELMEVYDSSATSTLFISSGGSGMGAEIILEDYDGGGCTVVRTHNGSMYSATTTCPTE